MITRHECRSLRLRGLHSYSLNPHQLTTFRGKYRQKAGFPFGHLRLVVGNPAPIDCFDGLRDSSSFALILIQCSNRFTQFRTCAIKANRLLDPAESRQTKKGCALPQNYSLRSAGILVTGLCVLIGLVKIEPQLLCLWAYVTILLVFIAWSIKT